MRAPWQTLLLACALVAAAAGCAGGDEPETSGAVTIAGGSGAQRGLANRLAARLDPAAFERIRIGPPNELWPVLGESWTGSGDAVGIDVVPAAGDSRSRWEALLLAGAFADLSAAADLPPVEVLGAGGGAGVTVEGEPPEDEPAGARQAEDLAGEVRAAVAAAGAELVDLDVLAPYGLAFAATVRTSEPVRFLDEELEAILALEGAADGWHVEVLDAAGEPVWRGDYAARADAISQETPDPALRGCGPLPLFPTDERSEPPPCPLR